MPRTPHSLSNEYSMEFELSLDNRRYELLAQIIEEAEDQAALLKSFKLGGAVAILAAIEAKIKE
jgi:hypothetical protein